MPEVISKRRRVQQAQPKIVESTLEYVDEKPAPKRSTSTMKDVPVGKIVSTTMQRRIAGSLARSTSMTMLNSVGPDWAITGTEAFNVYHPVTRIIGRHAPDLGIKINLPKADADDIELIITTGLEYLLRVIDGFFQRAYNKRVASLPQNRGQNTMAQPTQRDMPAQQEKYRQIVQNTIPVVDEELEEFAEMVGDVPDIAPMKNGNGSISDLMASGLIPGDMGDTVA